MNIIRNSGQVVVVVLGSTGTGKSKLAIEIAKKFCGEVISADSMQVYKELDIITNKVKGAEQQGIPHHLIDHVDPIQNYSVTDFRDQAVPLIEKLLNNRKLPVIVGGTNYYIEAVLWHVLSSKLGSQEKSKTTPELNQFQEILNSDISLYEKLKVIDPITASKLHPNDHRKISTSIKTIQRLGKLHSDVIEEQKKMDGGSSLGGPLRFKNACIFWIDADKHILAERLDKRVDDMVNQGLVEELLMFSKKLPSDNSETGKKDPDYTHGILQSIGFKEFHKYLNLTEEQKESDKNLSEKYLSEGIERLKVVTKQYARKQIKWIKNRFLRRPDREVPPIYKVDSSDASKWNENVYEPAIEIVSAHLSGSRPTIDPVPIEENPLSNEPITFHCEDCNRVFVGEIAWDSHMRSRRHKKVVESLKRKNKYEVKL